MRGLQREKSNLGNGKAGRERELVLEPAVSAGIFGNSINWRGFEGNSIWNAGNQEGKAVDDDNAEAALADLEDAF